MTVDDLKDQLAASFRQISDRVQETEFFINLKDRFDAQSPYAQKAIVAVSIALVFAMVLMFPWSWYSESDDVVAGFDSRRTLMREMLKVAREALEVPNIPMPPTGETLHSDVDARLKESNLVPEQIKAVEMNSSGDSKLIAAERSAGGLTVALWKLNVRQVVEIGGKLASINPSVKMTSLEVKANAEDPHYFDMKVSLTSLNVPDLSTPAPPPEEEAPTPKKKTPPKKKGADE